jgi:UDPglucose 6-dehydrogenase
MGRKIIHAMGGDARGKTVGILGLTFKPNTDDMRDAPSLSIIQALLDAGAKVRAFDPEGTEAARALLPEVDYLDDPYAVATDADAVAIVTEWDAFRALDLKRLAGEMRTRCLVDLRNIYDRVEVERAGLSYASVGR